VDGSASRDDTVSLRRNDPRHGTTNGYKNHGCRCKPCCEANTEAAREWRHRTGYTRPREQYLADATRHGGKRYRKGCRCEVCRAASAAQKARYRDRHREHEQAYDRERKRRQRAGTGSVRVRP